MGVGRPPKFNSVEELQEKIDKYFSDCDANNKPYTITGLALSLDTDRKTLITYEEKDEYFNTVKKAKTKIEEFVESQLFNAKVPTTGMIFNLKNNYGWVDKQEIEADVNANIDIDIIEDED